MSTAALAYLREDGPSGALVSICERATGDKAAMTASTTARGAP